MKLKFLLDENAEGFEKELVLLKHEVITAKKLRKEDEKFRNDYNLMNHAKDNNMIIITKDNEKGQRKAFVEFLKQNEDISAEEFFSYGDYGQVFIIKKNPSLSKS